MRFFYPRKFLVQDHEPSEGFFENRPTASLRTSFHEVKIRINPKIQIYIMISLTLNFGV